jgi:photosystem II stability/assembly factor-like uncharacterized protein
VTSPAETADAVQYRKSLAAGPRKTRTRRSPQPVFTTHKARSEWFRQREAWPFREPSGAAIVAERGRLATELQPAAGAEAWDFAGPTNVGGRITAMVGHPSDANRLLLGAAGGGLWRTLDGGNSWEGLWHREPTLNIGSLALDPANPETIYCGTGEANLSADSHPGFGLFVSRNGGDTWSVLADAVASGIPTRIGALAADPFNPSHLRLGGLTHSDGPDGMYASHDGGQSWERDQGIASGSYRCHAIVFDPGRQGTIFAVVWTRGTQSGLWRSRNGGQTWHQLTLGLPAASLVGRGALALAPSDTKILYLQLAQGRFQGSTDGVLGVFRSSNGGDTWTEVGGQHFAGERQMSYNNSIVVHPTDPDHVLCGGVELHRTLDGGASWRRVSRWDAEPGQPNYAHADQHVLLMPAARPGLVYAGNDGGLDVSENGGSTWANRSRGLAVTMYYDLDVAQSDRRVFGGGCQDNGTNLTLTGNPDDHLQITGGDGGWLVIDPTVPAHLFSSAQHMFLWRHRPADGWRTLRIPASTAEKNRVWMMFMILHPQDPTQILVGGTRLWRSTDDGDSWIALSASFDGSPISALEIARADPSRIYVGTENGGVFASTDGGATWSGDLSGPVLPGRTITRLKTRPDDASSVYATVANFMSSSVFHSADGGATWVDLDRGRLPRVPFNSVAVLPRLPDVVFLACDVGVLASRDAGGTWTNLTSNLPNVIVVDLALHEGEEILLAATYGRGIWSLDLAGYLAGG